MRLPTRQQIISWLPVILIIVLALSLRLYRITETNHFRGDEAMDLFVIENMEHNGHRPLIGSFLSLEGVNTPPTYYYISWMFFRLSPTGMGIVWGYFGLNMLTMFLLMKLAYDLSGKRLAGIVGFLFAVSAVMIEHGRQFWSPFPMQPLIAASLLCLWHAFRKKDITLLWISLFLYQFAFSVYPSPALLLPYYLYQCMRWYITVSGYTRKSAMWHSLGMIAFTFIAVFSPVIIFEATHGFPTATSIASVLRIGMNPDSALTSMIEHVVLLGAQFSGISGYFLGAQTYLTLLLAVLFTKCVPWRRISGATWTFLAPEYLLGGLSLLLIYPYEAHPHRVWALIPFLFLIVGIGLEYMFRKHGKHTVYAIAFLSIITVLNLYAASPYWTGKSTDEVADAKAASDAVLGDMHMRGYGFTDTSLFLMTFNKNAGQSYGIFRILYWMYERHAMPLRLNRNGNSFEYNYSVPDIKNHMYLFCWLYPTDTSAVNDCVKPLEAYGYDSRLLTKMTQTRVYLLERTASAYPAQSGAYTRGK